MNKDFWERIERLEELARKATQGEWSVDDMGYVFRNPQASSEEEKMPLVPLCGSMRQFETSRFDGTFIAAANPTMILEMIAEMRSLSSKIIEEQKRSERTENNNVELRNKLIQLEKAADWLACQLEKKEHACEFCYDDKCEGRYFNNSKCGYEGPDNWREAARKAVSEDK